MPHWVSKAPQAQHGLSRRSAAVWLGAVVCSGLLAACDGPSVTGGSAGFKGINISGAPYGRDFALTDFNGQPRTLADYRGQVVMLYFGFVQCPDVCPTALTRASAVMQQLGPDAAQVQLLFVTVDPERDTPALLREYMAAFDASFMALTGDTAQIKAAADEFRVFFKKIPTGSSYTMDHTALTYLFDRQGRLRLALRHEQSADDYAFDIKKLLAEKTH
jgi:protein SCO1/2